MTESKRNPRKSRLVWLGFLLIAMMLVACAPAPVETEEPAEPDAPAPTEAPTNTPEPTAVPEPVEIVLWANATVTEAGAPPDDWAAYDIIREELNIELTYVILPTGADGEAVVNAAAAANDLPDVFQIVAGNNDARGVLFRYVDLGLVAPVEDLMPLMPERAATHYNDPLAIDLVSADGHQWGLPEPPPIPRREGLVIRKDWLDALGLEVPTTTEELYEVAVAFTNEDPDGNGVNDTYGIGGFLNGPGLGTRFDFIFGAYGVPGVWNFTGEGDFGLNVRNENYDDALAYFNSLVAAGVIDPTWPTLTRDEFRANWKAGRYGIMWEDFAALTNKSNYAPFDENFPEGEWIPIAAPTGPNGDSYYGVYTGRGNIFAVSQNAVDAGKAEAIASLLEWIATDGYYLLGFGVEGENFVFDADGNISTEGIAPEAAWNSAEMQPFTQMRNQLVFYNSEVEIVARYPVYTTDASGKEIHPMDFLTFFQSQPWVDGRGVQVILPPANAADFERFYNEGLIAFALGQQVVNEANWEAFLAGLDGLGAADYEAAALEAIQAAGLD